MKKWAALLALFFGVTALACAWSADVPLAHLWSADAAARDMAERIYLDNRLPRVFAAMLVGASLASSGAALQAMFRNPLAEPYLLGISAGGALGATLATALDFPAWGGFQAAVLLAFAGSLLAATVVYQLGQARPGSYSFGFDRSSLLLCGVALSSFLAAMMAIVITLSPKPGLAQQTTFWLLGSLTRAWWAEIRVLAVALIAGLIILLLSARDVDALQIGDEEAAGLGVNVGRMHRRLMVAASLMSAAAVAAAGMIGFVGLLAPHIMRLSFGTGARRLFPASALGGATLLIACDAIAHLALPPIEIPVGVITSLLGVPLFLWLMKKL
jgi:iron complex transport system permease protein